MDGPVMNASMYAKARGVCASIVEGRNFTPEDIKVPLNMVRARPDPRLSPHPATIHTKTRHKITVVEPGFVSGHMPGCRQLRSVPLPPGQWWH